MGPPEMSYELAAGSKSSAVMIWRAWALEGSSTRRMVRTEPEGKVSWLPV